MATGSLTAALVPSVLIVGIAQLTWESIAD